MIYPNLRSRRIEATVNDETGERRFAWSAGDLTIMVEQRNAQHPTQSAWLWTVKLFSGPYVSPSDRKASENTSWQAFKPVDATDVEWNGAERFVHDAGLILSR